MQENTAPYVNISSRTVSSSFARMVAFSLLAHAIFSTAFILTHRGRHGEGPVQYIDLSMADTAAQAPQKARAAAEPQPAPAPQQVPESPMAPATASAAATTEPQPPAAAPAQPAFQQGSLGFGIVNGHFGSLSDGRTLRDDMREYYLDMLAKFNEAWWRAKAADGAGGRGAAFLVVVSRDGSIVDTNLIQSSGNPTYDRVMLQALKTAGPLGPLPQTYEGDFFSAPLRFVAPLNLMNPFSG